MMVLLADRVAGEQVQQIPLQDFPLPELVLRVRGIPEVEVYIEQAPRQTCRPVEVAARVKRVKTVHPHLGVKAAMVNHP
jgi:hypothetical protein